MNNIQYTFYDRSIEVFMRQGLDMKDSILLGVITIYVNVISSIGWYIFEGQNHAPFTHLYVFQGPHLSYNSITCLLNN